MAHVSPEQLASFLDNVENDEAAIEAFSVLEEDLADDLRSIFDVVESISPPPNISVDPLRHARMRADLISQMATVRGPKRESWPRRLKQALVNPLVQVRRVICYVEPKPVLAGGLVLALSLSFGGGAVFAAEGTIPGDPLYQVKLTIESVELAVAPNDEVRGEILVQFANVRLVEIDKASQADRPDSVRAASRSYAQEVDEASQSAVLASTAGMSVSDLESRLESTDQTRQAIVAKADVALSTGSIRVTAVPSDRDWPTTSVFARGLAVDNAVAAIASPALTAKAPSLPPKMSGPARSPAGGPIVALARTPVPPLALAGASTARGPSLASAVDRDAGRPQVAPTQPRIGQPGSPNSGSPPPGPTQTPTWRDRFQDRVGNGGRSGGSQALGAHGTPTHPPGNPSGNGTASPAPVHRKVPVTPDSGRPVPPTPPGLRPTPAAIPDFVGLPNVRQDRAPAPLPAAPGLAPIIADKQRAVAASPNSSQPSQTLPSGG